MSLESIRKKYADLQKDCVKLKRQHKTLEAKFRLLIKNKKASEKEECEAWRRVG
jgi:hypothetical protein